MQMYVDLIQLEEEMDEFLMDFGYQVVDLQYGGTRQSRIFRLFVDHIDGQPVTIDDCSHLSPQVLLFLEARELYNDNTRLEVSSAGLNRILKRSRDFERYIGSEVKVTFHTNNGRETIRGELASFNDDQLMIILSPDQSVNGGISSSEDTGTDSVRIDRGSLEKVNLVPQLEF